MDLVQWTELYVRHKDVLKRMIASIDRAGQSLSIMYKDGNKEMAICNTTLGPLAIPQGCRKVYVVVDNTQENLDALVKQWETFSAVESLTVIFVDVKQDRKWIVMPYQHHKVAADNIQKSLQALYDNCS